MARYLIRQAHGGETRTIRDGGLPYFLNLGWVVLDTLDDESDSPPLYLSKAEGDLRWAKISDLSNPESTEIALVSEALTDSPGLRATSVAAIEDADEVAPTGAWNFAQAPTVAGAPIGGGGEGVTDHGALTGLTDDDHPQYALADGSRGAFANAADITAASTADRARANHTGTQPAASISDLTEAAQDAVAAFLVAGVGVTVSHDDVANTFTINATGGGGTTDPEIVRDVIGTALVASSGIQITVNDAGDSITIASTAVLPTRQVVAGTGLTGGGDLTADRTLAVSYGSTAGTAVQGNDARVTADQAAGTASIRTLGTGAQQAAPGNDARFGVAGRRQTISAKTAAYTLAVADEEALITVNTAATAAVTLPNNTTVAIPVGAWTEILQLGVGQTTVTAASGVTLLLPAGATAACRGQNCRIVAQKIATNTFVLGGDLA